MSTATKRPASKSKPRITKEPTPGIRVLASRLTDGSVSAVYRIEVSADMVEAFEVMMDALRMAHRRAHQ